MARATDTAMTPGQWQPFIKSHCSQAAALLNRAMLRAISLLLACQLVGETIHRLIRVPLPGAVIGMVLLMIWLHVRRKERTELGTLSGWLTAHLALMFVPAAVGLIEEGKALSRYGVGLVTATIVSTLLTMAVTAYVFQFALRRSAVAAER